MSVLLVIHVHQLAHWFVRHGQQPLTVQSAPHVHAEPQNQERSTLQSTCLSRRIPHGTWYGGAESTSCRHQTWRSHRGAGGWRDTTSVWQDLTTKILPSMAHPVRGYCRPSQRCFGAALSHKILGSRLTSAAPPAVTLSAVTCMSAVEPPHVLG